ncbi:endonuclease/exonuclease/phosphatase family protein [Octadecabacter sp. G9-8]|uniref:Endonuclease/exonuclease/phosphatase family protein n=1 Tax=Octadecabacter dasysiphoniae TaxID=2909341 RepID=A0ABS9CX08_9RHOB|nr:endonuclease/exonuclease/phosphatase family protein [Octadecabacter dasysiphoniae]
MPTFVLAQSGETVRIATFAAPLSRDGPGLLLRDIVKGEDTQIAAIVGVIDHVAPDILVLTDFDFDAGGAAMAAFSNTLAIPYPYSYSALPNAGQQTGLDLDGDGFTGDARDAFGYGRFLGDGGMAILSRLPINETDVIDLSGTLWRDVPNAKLPMVDGRAFPSEQVHEALRVSSTGHWMVPISIGDQTITLLAYSATAPVFDGPEDFNGLRNRDELKLWEAVLDGALGAPPTMPVLIGNVNADPSDGQGLRGGIADVVTRGDLQDPMPRSAGGVMVADPTHTGDPALDTADWSDGGPGNLRVSYILPSAKIAISGAGVFWPAADDPMAALLGEDGFAAGPHRLVWVDIAVP